jgi:hypothetical protein
MRHLFARRPDGRRRWLDRRALVALVAGTAVVATAIYATGTHDSTPTHARQVAVIGSADTSGIASSDQLTLPFTLADLPQQIKLVTPHGVTSTTDPFPVVNQLIGSYQINVDAHQIQPFLDQTATVTTAQQITDDAHTFLVAQGLPQTTIDQAMADIVTLQAQPAITWPGEGEGEETWWGLRVALALLLLAALPRAKVSSSSDSNVNCKPDSGRWQGPPVTTDAGREAVLQLEPQRLTSGYAIDSNNLTYVFHNDPAPDPGQYTYNSSRDDQDVIDATTARLRWGTMLDMTSDSVHAEQKMATFMRACHIDTATFVINNYRICDVGPTACDTVLRLLLDIGQQLTVDYKVTTLGADPNRPCLGNPSGSLWRCITYIGA